MKSKLDKIVEEQRKNLRFVEDAIEPSKRVSSEFITVDSNKTIGAKNKPSLPANYAKTYGKPKVGGYVDIRKIKLDRIKKDQEELAKRQAEEELNNSKSEVFDEDEDDDKFGIDQILNRQREKINEARGLPPASSELKIGDSLTDIVPEPAAVREGRAAKISLPKRKKLDDDLVIKKTYNSYFDDLVD